jgi:hypothetical protein
VTCPDLGTSNRLGSGLLYSYFSAGIQTHHDIWYDSRLKVEGERMSDDFVTKTEAIRLVGIESGYGRHVVGKKIRELARAGNITIERDPLDKRKLRIRKADLPLIITALTGDL